MPTYEYRCKDCQHRFDVVQSFSEDALTTCAECGGRLAKVFGNVGITFKGSGFYKTDSRATSANGSSGEKDRSDNKDKSDNNDKSDHKDRSEATSDGPSTDKAKPKDSSPAKTDTKAGAPAP